MISTLEEIEQAVVKLPKNDLARFDQWYRAGVAATPSSDVDLPLMVDLSPAELQKVRDFMATQRTLVQAYETDA